MNWRLVDTGALAGPENMAIDEALLASFDPETSQPVFRLYGWSPPALSLGRFQDAGSVLNLDRCRAERVTLVRRITGGGVIYHADELTYSIVCAPHHLPRSSTVKESFRTLTAFLIRFYNSLGLEAEYAVHRFPANSGLGVRTPFCFAGRESYDIIVDGRKIGGNAQRRLKSAIFQHGSIPLRDAVQKGVRYLKETPSSMNGSVAALMDLGVDGREADLKVLLSKAFSAGVATGLTMSSLTATERDVAAELLNSRYTTDAWNLRGENA